VWLYGDGDWEQKNVICRRNRVVVTIDEKVRKKKRQPDGELIRRGRPLTLSRNWKPAARGENRRTEDIVNWWNPSSSLVRRRGGANGGNNLLKDFGRGVSNFLKLQEGLFWARGGVGQEGILTQPPRRKKQKSFTFRNQKTGRSYGGVDSKKREGASSASFGSKKAMCCVKESEGGHPISRDGNQGHGKTDGGNDGVTARTLDCVASSPKRGNVFVSEKRGLEGGKKKQNKRKREDSNGTGQKEGYMLVRKRNKKENYETGDPDPKIFKTRKKGQKDCPPKIS